jgi:hypothetical protein
LDRIVVEELDGGRRRRCVTCGHTDTLEAGSAPQPPTRFSRRSGPDTPATAVRIIDRSRRDP